MKIEIAWADRALCRELPHEAFFDARMATVAVAACRRCPVMDECRHWTDQTEGRTPLNALAGVFGAETPRQRYRRRRDERRLVQAPAA
jgi:Transcription factor WhiB